MKLTDRIDEASPDVAEETAGADLLLPLLVETARNVPAAAAGVVIGEIIAIADDGQTPVVRHAAGGAPVTAAARSVVVVQAAHVGRQVVLLFEGDDLSKPIVVGVLLDAARFAESTVGTVELEIDGARTIVTAQEQLVLRCGKSSITLTKAGKVLIQGEYVSSRSSGVNRIKGGSVEIN